MEYEILQWFVGKKMTYKARYIKKNTVWNFTVGIDVALIFQCLIYQIYEKFI